MIFRAMRVAGLAAFWVVVALPSTLMASGTLDSCKPQVARGEIEDRFVNPPRSSKPGVWWRWIDGNVTKEGITRDLTEMARQGIAVVDIFDVNNGANPVGPAGMMGPLWREMFRHTLDEAARLGVEVNVVAAAGWGMGGPWIDEINATKALDYAEIQVEGPRRLECRLPRASGAGSYYRDVLTVAFREPAHAPLRPASVTASSNMSGYCGEWNYPAEEAADGDPETCWSTAYVCPATLDFTYRENIMATGAMIVAMPKGGPAEGEVQASIDGKTFRRVTGFTMQPGESKRLSFAPTEAKVFRLVVTRAHVPEIRLAEFQVLRAEDEPRLRPGIKWWKFKSGRRSFWNWPAQGPAALREEYDGPEVADCRSEETVDLSARLSPDGTLVWEVPAGRWTIARFGMVLVGERPRAMSLALRGGYEADPYSRKAADALYDNTAKILLADATPQGRKALKGILIDSYEIGASARGLQGTWTEGFREMFRRQHGYDLLPYLPALARRVVDDRRTSNRFLWDYRQTLSALYNAFYEQLTQRAHADGLVMRAENGYGTYPFPHIDGLAANGRIDVPMGEFWTSGLMGVFYGFCDSVKSAASAAHIYDKKLVGAESLTIAHGFSDAPGKWKAQLDKEYCSGLNQAMIHLWSLQYEPEARPGLHSYEAINANMTWWPYCHDFLAYLARCQELLRQGRPVADVCYFLGEDTCMFVPGRGKLNPSLPPGCDFDGINAEVLTSRLACRGDRIVLPNGISYRYLVLPGQPGWPVTVPVLDAIAKLVKDGATVIGPRPGISPSLSRAGWQDRRIGRLSDMLWGSAAASAGERHVGQGRVIWGRSLEDIFAADQFKPDVVVSNPAITYIHRQLPDVELYFMANGKASAEQAVVTFRAVGRQPELWDPLTGCIRDLPEWRQEAGRTVVPMQFAPGQSWFVVFRRPLVGTARRAVRSESGAPGGRALPNFSEPKLVQELTGPWEVEFDPRWFYPDNGTGGKVRFEKLEDWTKRPEAAVKYFSGTAIYRKTFDVQSDVCNLKSGVYLDFGAVNNVARVRLNGRDFGVLWCDPWRVGISGAVRERGNTLEIEVANLWANRLIGDAGLPKEQRRTRTNRYPFKETDKLLPSGLLGPVRVLAER